MWQKIHVIGRLGGDPTTHTTAGGATVASFSLATDRTWRDASGEQQKETVWWRVSAWGKLGEICQQYLSKGRLVFIEGEMVPDKETGGPRLWTDQEGNTRASFEIRADTMKMLGGAESAPQQPAAAPPRREPRQRKESAAQAPRPATAPTKAAAADWGDLDPDEVPF